METCLLAMREMQNFVDLLPLHTQSNKTLSSKGAFSVYLNGRPSSCTLSKRRVAPKGDAPNLSEQTDLAYCGVNKGSFTMGCIALPNDALYWQFCCRSTGKMDSLSWLMFTESESSAQAVPWLLRFSICVR